MGIDIQEIIANSVIKLLKPLIRILLQHGIAYGTFSEWAKKAYVDTAYNELKRRQQKATITSVSAFTGLTRKETKRLSDIDHGHQLIVAAKYNRATRVISGWLEDPNYQDAEGKPAPLYLDSKSSPSFAELVKQHSGDMTTIAMLDLLKEADCVSLTGDQVELIKYVYIPKGASSSKEKIAILGSDTAELIATIQHNLNSEETQPHFQRKVFNTMLAPESVAAFRELSAAQSQQLLENFNQWLQQNEVEPADENQGKYVAVGIYYTEYQPSSEEEV